MTLVGAGLSLLLAFVLPVRYTSTIKLLPEYSSTQTSNLHSAKEIAEAFGVDFNGQAQVEAIRPDLYPSVLASVPFMLSLLHLPVQQPSQSNTPLYQVLTRQRGLFAPDSINGLPLPTDRPIRWTKSQRELVEYTQKMVRAELNSKTGIITVMADMPSPELAAQVVEFAADYLKQYVQDYRTQKARQYEETVRRQLVDAQRKAGRSEESMLAIQDQTRFFSLPSAGITNRRLSSQFQSDNRLYQDLQYEHAKAKLNTQALTPVFELLEPAQVPDRKSSPRRVWIVLAGAMSGFILSGLYWLVRGAFGI